uniref:Uncharacterized protein n=1 Tax=Romanomermis culicivorax TaxID=13658 RepID=A0A915KWN5_ROMCU
MEKLQKEVAELKEIIIHGNANQRVALQREMPPRNGVSNNDKTTSKLDSSIVEDKNIKPLYSFWLLENDIMDSDIHELPSPPKGSIGKWSDINEFIKKFNRLDIMWKHEGGHVELEYQ